MTLAVVIGAREARTLLAARPDARGVLRAPDLPASTKAVIDASHPCEGGTQADCAAWCAQYGVPYLRLRRPEWLAGQGDAWRVVADAAAARAALGAQSQRVFLTLGPAERDAFANDSARWYLVRMRGRPGGRAPLSSYTVTGDTPPFTVQHEAELMTDHRIDTLVARNAGGAGAWPKVAAARLLGLPVVMVARPASSGPEVATVAAALDWAETCAPR